MSIAFVAGPIITSNQPPKLQQPKKSLGAMSQSPESGQLPFSNMQIAVGLQALAVACLVSWLVRDAGPPQLTRKKATQRPREARRAWLIIIPVVVSMVTMTLGVADMLGLRDNDSASQSIWPQAAESQPLELWDQAWEMFKLWAEVVTEPLLPGKAPYDGNNLYAAFHLVTSPSETIGKVCSQRYFIAISTLEANTKAPASSANTRESIIETCGAAQDNLHRLEHNWADVETYFRSMYLGLPIRKLNWVGYNISRFQNRKETTTTDGRDESSWYGFSKPEGAGIAGPGYFHHTFNNETALQILAIVNPSFPELRPAAVNMTRKLRSLEAEARTAIESIAVVSELLPLELHEETPDASFMKRWVGFDFYNWWSDGDTDDIHRHSPAARVRAAKELARLHDLVKTIHAVATECVRRAGAIESSLDMLERKVTALAHVKKPKQGRTAVSASGVDGAWATLGWRADCRCDSETQTSSVRAVAIPVVVVHFVPSAETLFQGLENAHRLLSDKEALAVRQRDDYHEEWNKMNDRKWHKISLEYEASTVPVDENGCFLTSVDENGNVKCLSQDEVEASVGRRFQDEFGLAADPSY